MPDDNENDEDYGRSEIRSYLTDNIDADGNYIVGRNRPPEHGKFRAGDGRRRGRRKKGTRNLATDFHEELASKVTLKVDGKPRRVTKQRAIMMRLMDNASRGQNPAIRTIIAYAEKFGIEVQFEEPEAQSEPAFNHVDELSDYERELLVLLLAKASGEDPFPMDGKRRLYDDQHPLAYLEDPDDERNYYLDTTIEGVCWRRFTGVRRFSDHIVEIRSEAYNLAAIARPDEIHNCAEEQ